MLKPKLRLYRNGDLDVTVGKNTTRVYRGRYYMSIRPLSEEESQRLIDRDLEQDVRESIRVLNKRLNLE